MPRSRRRNNFIVQNPDRGQPSARLRQPAAAYRKSAAARRSLQRLARDPLKRDGNPTKNSSKYYNCRRIRKNSTVHRNGKVHFALK